MRSLLALALLLALPGCVLNRGRIEEPRRAVAVTTPDISRSMVYLARTDSGVIAVDLGYITAGGRVRAGLKQLGATPADVRAVFLTHSHRDHIRGWPTVRAARFYLAATEAPLFRGEAEHGDLPSRLAEALFANPYPLGDSLEVRPFARDTAVVLGTDTLRAFFIPGHTAGSAAYLFRRVLFVGDALAFSYLRGFGYAKRPYTVDWDQNRASVLSLWERTAPFQVDWVCTAHAKCARPAALRRKLH